MPNLLETLEQETMWYGQDGYPYRLAVMEQSHRHNVLAFLRRRAHDLYDRKEWHEAKALYGLASTTGVPANVLAGQRMLPQSPLDWLNDRPFVRALERSIMAHDAIEPDKLELEA